MRTFHVGSKRFPHSVINIYQNKPWKFVVRYDDVNPSTGEQRPQIVSEVSYSDLTVGETYEPWRAPLGWKWADASNSSTSSRKSCFITRRFITC